MPSVEAHMRHPEPDPRVELASDPISVAISNQDPCLKSESARIPTTLLDSRAHLGQRLTQLLPRYRHRHPPVSQIDHSADGALTESAADPDRHRPLWRKRADPDPCETMETVEAIDILTPPQRPQHRDLLIEHRTALGERTGPVERQHLDFVPPHS